jgi:urease accessory protein
VDSAGAIRKSTGWRAELHLRFASGSGSDAGPTRLIERRHLGPLVVQRSFHPEGLDAGKPCHVYLVHPPGGVVGGDELRIDVQADPRAHALITTPAATKFYRCEGRVSTQTQELRAAGATLEWLPQENIFYRGADVRTATRVHLDADSRFIGWEINCLGLPARGEPFDAGALRLDLELWRESPGAHAATPGRAAPVQVLSAQSHPVFLDHLRLQGESRARQASWGLAGQEAVGTLLATPARPEHVAAVRALIEAHPFAAVSLVDGVLVLRALAPQAEALRHLFFSAWRALRPVIIGREAVAPRIWNT